MNFSHYKLSHLFAGLAAITVHGAIVVASMSQSNPIPLNQQAIQVSFVAPSGANGKSENLSHKKNATFSEAKNAAKKIELEKQEQQTLAGKETSGRVDPNSKASRAAESQPVFDAAYLNNPAPFYPQSAKQRGIQGKVLLNVVVKTDGSPLTVAISRSSGSSLLDEAALDAVRQWRFVPARSKGQNIQADVIVPVEFKII